MKIERITLIFICLILLVATDPGLSFFRDILAYAQLIQGSSSVSQLQRLGTTNILNPPNEVSLVFSNHKNSSLDEQFILLGNNLGTRQKIAISNPDYGLSALIPTLTTGENFNINSSIDSDIVYTTASVKLVPITSPFPPNNIRVEDVDPENDISLGTSVVIGNYTGNVGSFVIPHAANPGYYLLYVYFYYPTYNITLVYNTAIQLKGSGIGTRQ